MVNKRAYAHSGKRKYKINNSRADQAFDVANILIMILLLFIFIWPLWFVVISSFSNPYEVWRGNVLLWFKGFTLKGYDQLFQYQPVWIGYRNNILYTGLGSVINMIMTVLCAYPLSRKDWFPRNFWMKFCLITMYFSGGLIPTYLVVKGLGMTNTIWAMMIPSALSFYNALIVRSYFMNSIPFELQEASELDGANPAQYLALVVLPLSKPGVATIGLFTVIAYWNDWFLGMLYIFETEKYPIQTLLQSMQNSLEALTQSSANALEYAEMAKNAPTDSGRMALTVLVVLPVMLAYPFFQKYFVKGLTVGGVKG